MKQKKGSYLARSLGHLATRISAACALPNLLGINCANSGVIWVREILTPPPMHKTQLPPDLEKRLIETQGHVAT